MMKQLGCTTNSYSKFPFERALEGIADAGLKYVEIGAVPIHCEHVKPELLDDRQIKELRNMIQGYGLTPMSISGHCDLATDKGVELFKKRIDFACDIQVGIVNTAAGEIRTKADEENFFENMKTIVTYLKEREIIAALECHGGIVGSGKACRNTLERIGSDYVKINYDPANVIYYEGLNPQEDMMDVIEYITHFHVKDKLEGKGVWNFPAMGDGYIDFKALFDALNNNNYYGPFSFEIEFIQRGPDTPEEVDFALKKSVRYFNQLMGDYCDKHA